MKVCEMIDVDGTNEAMLNRLGFSSATLDALVASGDLRFEVRRYSARGQTGLDVSVRRFYRRPS